MANRPDSVFKSTKKFLGASASLAVETTNYLGNEIKATAKLSTIENAEELFETKMSSYRNAKAFKAEDDIEKQLLEQFQQTILSV